MDDWGWIASAYNNLFCCAVSSLESKYFSLADGHRSGIRKCSKKLLRSNPPSWFLRIAGRWIHEWLETFLFTAFMLTHRDKEGWRGELFPLLNSGWGVRICQPPLGSCRLPLSSKVFPRSRKLRAMRGERGVEVCMKGGEKRDRFLVACAHGDPFSPNSNLVTSLLRR